MNLNVISNYLKEDRKEFSFKEPTTVMYNKESKTYSTYTITKLLSATEKKLIAFYTDEKNKTRSVLNIIADAITFLDGKEVTRGEVINLLYNLPSAEIELLFVNIRLFTYGNEVKQSYVCQGQTYMRNERNQIAKDEAGEPIMKKCGASNTVLLRLDEDFYKTDEEIDEDKDSIKKNEVILIDNDSLTVKVIVGEAFKKERDKELYRKIPQKVSEKYSWEILFAMIVQSVEIEKDGELESMPVSINDFFNKGDTFDASLPSAKQLIDFYGSISTPKMTEIKELSVSIGEKKSYLNLGYKDTCKSCGHENDLEISIFSPLFLLPSLGK